MKRSEVDFFYLLNSEFRLLLTPLGGGVVAVSAEVFSRLRFCLGDVGKEIVEESTRGRFDLIVSGFFCPLIGTVGVGRERCTRECMLSKRNACLAMWGFSFLSGSNIRRERTLFDRSGNPHG